MTLDDLAAMMQRQFEALTKHMDEGFSDARADRQKIRQEMADGFEAVNGRLDAKDRRDLAESERLDTHEQLIKALK